MLPLNQILEHENTKLNMNSLGWYPLQERRAKLKLTFFYKIINNLSISNKLDLIPTNSPRRLFFFRVPQSCRDLDLHSFFPSTISLWNYLTLTIKNSSSLSRRQLKVPHLFLNFKFKIKFQIQFYYLLLFFLLPFEPSAPI